MADAKAPDMERIKKRVLADYRNGKKPKELAEKYHVNLNTVKSWIKRGKVKPDTSAGTAAAGAAGAEGAEGAEGAGAKRGRGAPRKNTNAVGKTSGAPAGNTRALIHGGYSRVYWDTLTPEEQALLDDSGKDPEELLLGEITLLSIRERRIMARIRKISAFDEKNPNGLGLVVSGIVRDEDKREFENPEDKKLYESIQRAKVENGDILPGRKYHISTRTEATYDVVHRLEEALTRCQAQKQRCIQALMELRAMQPDSVEVEDLDGVEELIYGSVQNRDSADG